MSTQSSLTESDQTIVDTASAGDCSVEIKPVRCYERNVCWTARQ